MTSRSTPPPSGAPGTRGAAQSVEDPPVDEQRRFWNTWNTNSRSPGTLNQWTSLRGSAILQKLDALGLEKPRIMDLGCGTGWLSEQLAERGLVTAIDLSDECIADARQRAPHIEFIAGNLFEVPLPEGHFDIVVSQDVVAHVTDQPRFAALCAWLLKPGGHLIITTTNRFVVERMDLPPQPPEHIEHWLTMRGLRRLLRPHFAVVETTTVMPIGSKGILRLVNSSRLQTVLAPLATPATLVALKERLGLGYNLLAVARKAS